MLFDKHRPHVFREQRIAPSEARVVAKKAQAQAERMLTHHVACEAFAVHVAKDNLRVMTVEAWRDLASLREVDSLRAQGTAVYSWLATGGVDPTPVTDPDAGVIVIDVFKVWRPLVRPVSAFNARNGEAFNDHPGCVSTTVLRGIGSGSIATYARWRRVEDFLDAFSTQTKRKVRRIDDINTAAASMTWGFIRPDYHAYDLVSHQAKAP